MGERVIWWDLGESVKPFPRADVATVNKATEYCNVIKENGEWV